MLYKNLSFCASLLSTMDEHGAIIKESSEIDAIKKRIVGIEIESNSLKSTLKAKKTEESQSRSKPPPKPKICEECGEQFTRNCDFETHLLSHHKEKQFECDVCDKKFFLKWRLKKHKQAHEQQS